MTGFDVISPEPAVKVMEKRPWPWRLLEQTGQRVIETAKFLLMVISTALAVLQQGLRPLTWRRTVRREFIHQCYLNGLSSLIFTMIVGSLVGIGLVYQLIYWLELFGQKQLIGHFLVLVLAREIAPVLVGLIVLGRNGSRMLVELGNQKAGGQVHMLDSLGVDPFLILVVPRVLATALTTFCLTVVLIVVASGTGFVVGNALEVTALTITDFLTSLLNDLGPSEFVLIFLKSTCIGFSVGLFSCIFGLSEQAAVTNAEALIPRTFAFSFLAIMLLSVIFTLLF